MKNFDATFASVLDKHVAYPVLLIRLLVGFHLLYAVHGVLFNEQAMNGVVGFFASQNIILPGFVAPLTAWCEAICACLLIAGVFTRIASAALIIIFVNAIVIVHLGNPYPDAFPALVILVISIFLLVYGAGKLSIDSLISGK